MLQLKGLMIGVLLGKLQNKSAWLVSFLFPSVYRYLSISLSFFFLLAPDNLTNLLKIFASFVDVHFFLLCLSFY